MLNKWRINEMNQLIDNVSHNMRADSQIEILSILTQTLTKKGNVRVIFGSKTPYTDLKSSQIFLPRQIFPDSFVDWILKKAISLHEAFHILFSGNSKKFVDKFRKTTGVIANCNFDWKFFKMCLNSIEDVRIEYLGMNMYKGCPELLGFALSFFHKLALIERDKMITDVLYSLGFELREFKTLYPNRKLMDKLISVSKDVIHQNFEGCVKIALEVYDILNQELPESEKESMKSTRNKKFDNGVGQTQDQDFEFNGKKDDSKLSEKDSEKIKDEFEEAKEDFEEMLEDDEELKKQEEDDEEGEDSEEENTEDDDSEGEQESEKKSGKSGESEEDEEEEGDDSDSQLDKFLKSDLNSEENRDKIVKIIKEKFKSEYTTQEKIEKQIRIQAEEESEKLKKEFEDSDGSGLTLQIPKKNYDDEFNISRANSTADMIAQELKNRIIIGRTLISEQTSGKLKLKDAIRSLVKYKISDEFDNHIYEQELIETPEHSVLLMIDCSGSMRNRDSAYDPISGCNVGKSKSKLTNAKEVIYTLGKVFETLSVKCAIRGFEGRGDYLVKKWDDELDVRKINGLTSGDNTPTAEATMVATKKMEEIEDELKIIFTITDGCADKTTFTKDNVDVARAKGIHVFGIFYGIESQLYKNNFEYVYGKDNFIMAKDSEELKEGIVKLYENLLKKASYGGE
jgi:hypothetical protein